MRGSHTVCVFRKKNLISLGKTKVQIWGGEDQDQGFKERRNGLEGGGWAPARTHYIGQQKKIIFVACRSDIAERGGVLSEGETFRHCGYR